MRIPTFCEFTKKQQDIFKHNGYLGVYCYPLLPCFPFLIFPPAVINPIIFMNVWFTSSLHLVPLHRVSPSSWVRAFSTCHSDHLNFFLSLLMVSLRLIAHQIFLPLQTCCLPAETKFTSRNHRFLLVFLKKSLLHDQQDLNYFRHIWNDSDKRSIPMSPGLCPVGQQRQTSPPNPGPENIGPWETRALVRGIMALSAMLICQTQDPGHKEHWEHGADLLADHASK